jgi:hypothetical protein
MASQNPLRVQATEPSWADPGNDELLGSLGANACCHTPCDSVAMNAWRLFDLPY